MMKTLTLLFTLFTACPLLAEQGKAFQNSNTSREAELSDEKSTIEKAKVDLIVDLSTTGELSIGEDKFTHEALKKKLQAMTEVKKDLTVQIRASAKVEYKKVAGIIETCHTAGVLHLSFSTQK